MRFAVVVAVSGLLASAGARAADTCAARAEAVGRALAEVPAYVQLVPPQLDVELPRAPALGRIERLGLAIDVRDDRYAFQSARAPLDDLDPLDDELEGVLRAEHLTKARRAPAYVRLHRHQALQPALSLMCKIVERRETVLLVHDSKRDNAVSYRPPPPPPQLVQVLGQIDGLSSVVQRAAAMSNVLQQAIGKCAPLRERIEALAEVTPLERARRLREVVPEGLVACRCEDADVDAIEAMLLRILAPTQPPAYGIRLELACGEDPAAKVVRLPADATAQALAEALVKTEGKIRVRIAGKKRKR